MGYEVLKETPLSVEKMSNLDGIIWPLRRNMKTPLCFWAVWKI